MMGETISIFDFFFFVTTGETLPARFGGIKACLWAADNSSESWKASIREDLQQQNIPVMVVRYDSSTKLQYQSLI
jgi:hypothetical protein